MGRIAEHHGAAGVEPGPPQVLQAQVHFAFGVNIAQAQQFVKIAVHAPRFRLAAQRAEGAGRKDDLPQPGGPERFQRFARAVQQGAGGAGGDVILHKAAGQFVKAVAGKIKPGAGVIVLHREAEDRPVLFAVVPLRIAEPRQQTVERVFAQLDIIQQGTVPVPQDQFRAHRVTSYFIRKFTFR